MKHIITYIFLLTTIFSFAQEEDKALELASKRANNLVYDANDLAENNDFVSAEMEYRKALSEKPTSVSGTYNLAHSYYKKGNYEEALYRNKQAAKHATSKTEKHKAFHNIGNILMQNKKCKEAVEAYKSALRNDPTDDESRYNLGIAKDCAKQQQEDQQEEDKDGDNKKDKKEDENKDDNKDKKDKEDKDKEQKDQEDKGDKDKKEGDDQKDEDGKPKDEKEDKGKEGDNKKEQQKPQQQPGQLSPQQIKNLLEAMNNQEQKVQEKMNAKKAKGVKIQTEKDW